MDPSITLSGIVPLLPEIVLAGGGMALLMLGVFRKPGSPFEHQDDFLCGRKHEVY
jgi:hypothetical protein